jgi:predicted DCC family thiol-disulfide oxidoreductase YuxK
MNPTPRFPLQVFFDGACPLCSREIDHYRRQDHQGRLLPIDISAPGFDPHSYGISLEAFMAELHAIDQSGTVYRGVAAFRAIWQAFPEKTAYRVLARLVGLPLVEPLAGRAYRLFARLRPHLPGRKPGCDGGSCRLDR